MPKQKPRNAFFFYMLNFREEQKRKGIVYKDMVAVADAAGPLWKSAPPNIRMIYTAKATEEKERLANLDDGTTSSALSGSNIRTRQHGLEDAEEAEFQDIENFVKLKHIDKTLHNEDIFLIDVNSYCKSNYTGYLIGEVTILRFSLQDGIKDFYHTLINPDSVPYGYGSDIKNSCKEYGLKLPDEANEKSDYVEILDSIIHFMIQWDPDSKNLPIIYTIPDKVDQIRDFMTQLCKRKADVDISDFRIYQLNILLYLLSINTVTNEEDVFQSPTQAFGWIERDVFIWTPRAGCKYHNYIDKAMQCTTSRTKRWAYSVMSKTAGVYGPLKPGAHVPAQDVDHDDNSSSGNSSFAGSTHSLSFDYESNQSEACERLPQPIIRQQAPSVSSDGVGRGRGRIFDLLKIMNFKKCTVQDNC